MFDLAGNTSVDTGLSGYKQHVCFGAKSRRIEKRNDCCWIDKWKKPGFCIFQKKKGDFL